MYYLIVTGGLFCTKEQWKIKPVWGIALTWEKPDKSFFWEPNNKTLHAGIFDKFVNPPATPGKNIKNICYCTKEINKKNMYINYPLSLQLLMHQQ